MRIYDEGNAHRRDDFCRILVFRLCQKLSDKALILLDKQCRFTYSREDLRATDDNAQGLSLTERDELGKFLADETGRKIIIQTIELENQARQKQQDKGLPQKLQ